MTSFSFSSSYSPSFSSNCGERSNDFHIFDFVDVKNASSVSSSSLISSSSSSSSSSFSSSTITTTNTTASVLSLYSALLLNSSSGGIVFGEGDVSEIPPMPLKDAVLDASPASVNSGGGTGKRRRRESEMLSRNGCDENSTSVGSVVEGGEEDRELNEDHYSGGDSRLRFRTFSGTMKNCEAVRSTVEHFSEFRKGVPGFPRILLVSRRHIRKDKYINFVGEYHLDLLQRFGGAPVIVPRSNYTYDCLEMYIPMDGFMITEGEDLGVEYDPYRAEDDDGEDSIGLLDEAAREAVIPKHADNTTPDHSKDRIEWEVLSRCRAQGIPFLGICRGAQILNVLSGGSLYFDISLEIPSNIEHISYTDYDNHRHSIKVVPSTPLSHWFHEQKKDKGQLPVMSVIPSCLSTDTTDTKSTEDFIEQSRSVSTAECPSSPPANEERKEEKDDDHDDEAEEDEKEFTMNVNSYHHQGIKKLAKCFRPMAFADDGLIEAFYDPSQFDPDNGMFCVGLQFHPERMLNDYPGCVRVYEDFMRACWNYRSRRLQSEGNFGKNSN